MRYREFKLIEQQLDELKMSPGSLGAFAKSPLAKGIQAGFEAELIFPDLGGPDEDGEMEPDYDEDQRAYSIDDILEFFSYDDFGYGISPREERNLRSSLEEAYWEYSDEQMMSEFQNEAESLIREYIEEHDFDWDERTREYLTSELNLSDEETEQVMLAGQAATSTSTSPKEYLEARAAVDSQLDDLVRESIENQDGTYDTVLDEFRDSFSWPEEREFLSDQDISYMSDVADRYNLSWPYMRIEGGDDSGFNEDNAEQLADDLNRTLGYTTKVSSGYHGAKRDSTSWIFEPDSSLNANQGDMPVEIVSPPMPLDETLKALEDFFSWAKGHNAYTNSSTGFHMGVSLPEVGGKVDFVKLALFLGDEYVLQEFGRQAVGYCEAAMKKIRNRIKGNDERVADAMSLMRKGLIDVAHNSIASDEGFGKYTSINPKGNYIEFRSAGGEDYFKDIPKLRNMLLRYAQAMVVAADPQAERNEYYKKLYKLIAPAKGNASLDLFARFATGAISKEELKNQWAKSTLEKEAPELLKKTNWKVVIKSSGQPLTGYEFNGYTRDEAYDAVKQKMSPASSQQDFDQSFTANYELRDVGTNTGKWSVIDMKTQKTLGIVDGQNRGEAADAAHDKYNGYEYYIEPYVSTEPKPLSRRAELAKRIAKPQVNKGPGKYALIKDTTGEVVYEFESENSERAENHANAWLLRTYGKFLRDGGYTVKHLPGKSEQPSKPRNPQQIMSSNGVPMWDIYQRSNGLSLHQFADHNQTSAWSAAQTWARENGFELTDLSLRPVMPQV